MVNQSQFISQFGFPQDGDVKHPTSSIESLLEETISGEWGTDCADDYGTRVIRTTNFTNDGVLNLDDVVLRSIDQKKVEKKHLHKGDIILEKSGGTKDNPVGRLVYFAEDGIYLANNFTQVLRPSNSVNSRYLFAALYYLYQTHKPLIKGLGNQTNGIQNLKVPQYLQLQVCVPDRKEQDAFEQVLQRADKSKFAGFKSQFIEMFGKISQDKKLAEISEIYDGVHQTPHYTDSGIKFISVEDISDIYGSKKYISIEDYNKYKHVPELGDLIMTRIGTIGLCAVVSKSEPLAYYVSVTLIKPNHNIIDSTFLKYYIESGYGQNELRMRSLLEAFPMKINLNEIGKVAVKVPSMESQLAFVQIVQRADKSKYLN